MRFAGIQGNGDVKRVLAGMVDEGRIPHAILFHEDDGCGAVPMCVAFLQYLWCPDRADGDSCGVCPACNKISKLIHPDVHFVFPVAATSSLGESEKKHPISDYFLDGFRQLVLTNP